MRAEMGERMEIRYGTPADLEAVTALERTCFPPGEAAGREEFALRLRYYGSHFWLLWEGDKLISFVDGFVTDLRDLTDEMYARADMHDEHGAWQMIFGVNTHPEYRRRGCAALLLRRAIADAEAQGRQGMVLTCKPELIRYYARFGFRDEGVSASVHGGAKWVQMRLSF